MKEAKKRETSGELGGAIESYTAAIEFARACAREPDYMLYYKRACTYQKMGEVEKAADDFKVFLLADDRHAKLDTDPWGFLVGATKAAQIGLQQAKAQRCVTQQAFKKILSTYDFSVDYSNKKLYDWGHVMIGDTSEESRKMLKEKPQEAAYRIGVKHLLQGKHKKAIQHLDEAIKMNSEDARSYLFRGIAYALQSHKDGRFGPNRSARKLGKTKAISDFERAKALSKDDALTKQTCTHARARYILKECPSCGKMLVEYADFCQYCGKTLKEKKAKAKEARARL